MTVVVLCAYALGVILGIIALRITRFQEIWSRIIRTQLLLVAVIISITAVWEIDSLADVAWPVMIIVAAGVLIVVSFLTTRGDQRLSRGALNAWSAFPNTGFFVLPVAAATVGPSGVVVAVLIDRLGAPLWAFLTWALRRDAPLKQRFHTSWIDQSPNLGVAIGLVLRFTVPPPDWSSAINFWAGPLFAATGAAIFIGSAFHPSQRVTPRKGVRRWASTIALRIALLTPLFIFAPTTPVAIVTVLCALSIPAFGPVQYSRMYGYANPVVAASNRYGWIVGAAGLAIALLMVHLQ